jgi:hypothetical protein
LFQLELNTTDFQQRVDRMTANRILENEAAAASTENGDNTITATTYETEAIIEW